MSDLLDRETVTAMPSDEVPCPCGSGLRQLRCCGLVLEQVEIVLPEGPHAEQLSEITYAYRRGDRETVHRLALEVLEVSPGQRDALGALYNVLKDARKFEAAGAVVDRLARLHVNDPVSRLIAAQYFLVQRDLAMAQVHGRMLIRLAPLSATAHLTMGKIFLASGNPMAAEHHIRIAKLYSGEGEPAITPIEIEATLANALREQGRLSEARDVYAALTETYGAQPLVLIAWAALEEADRKFDAAIELIDRVLTFQPDHPQATIAKAALHRRLQEPEKALTMLESFDGVAQEQTIPAEGLLQKGWVLDSIGRYEEAFALFEEYKHHVRQAAGHGYLAEPAREITDALTEFFSQGRVNLLPRADVRADSPQPIFIVGFPRSGTTLIEQTLTSHPNIAAGDELPIIGLIANRAQMLLGSPAAYPAALSDLWIGDRIGHINTLRDLYLNEAMQMGALDPAKPWFTDKMPLNEMHLGLIHLLFPKSPVIHLVRHPLDVVLSVFSNGLTHGYYCAYSLEGAAQHYALIADLIGHYRSTMPIQYHAVRYEDFVADQEQKVRDLLAFVGESFDERTLLFHENRRTARTASYAQVTEPLYTRSRFRYRNYVRQLEPVIPILMPAIERLGYSVE